MSLFSKKAYIGLDIGHHAIKAVQVERTHTGWLIAKTISTLTPVDTVRDGIVIDPTLLGLAIKNMLREGHIHATSAAIAISGGTVVVRPVRMPKMAESALRKSIRFEASRYVPNSIEDSYIEFEIIGDADATNMDVIIAAAPKELIDSRIEACENAGLEVEHVEVATFAAYRSVVEADITETWEDKTLGLIDIGASVTNLGVISNGAFSMTRAIPAGGQILTDALKGYFKLTDQDAESGKAQLDVRGLMNEATVAENPPLRVLHTHVDDLVREVRRSINYWQSQQSEGASAKRMDGIILVGGGANLPGIAEYFQQKLGITTMARGLYENSRFLGAHAESNRGMELAVAVGLAMGLAPAKAVVRAVKPVALEATSMGSTPPKPPKPPKPTKGKTFKVSRPVEATTLEPEATQHSDRDDVAALLTDTSEPQQRVPAAFASAPTVHAGLDTHEPASVSEVEPPHLQVVATTPTTEPEELIATPAAFAPEPIAEVIPATPTVHPDELKSVPAAFAPDPIAEVIPDTPTVHPDELKTVPAAFAPEPIANEVDELDVYRKEMAHLLHAPLEGAPIVNVEADHVSEMAALLDEAAPMSLKPTPTIEPPIVHTNDVAALLDEAFDSPLPASTTQRAATFETPSSVSPRFAGSEDRISVMEDLLDAPASKNSASGTTEKQGFLSKFTKKQAPETPRESGGLLGTPKEEAKPGKQSLLGRFAKKPANEIPQATATTPEAPASDFNAVPDTPNVDVTTEKVSLFADVAKVRETTVSSQANDESLISEMSGLLDFSPTAAKSDEPAKESSGFKRKLSSAVSWMFGSPPPVSLAKPTGLLKPPATANRASAEPQSEAPRGVELESAANSLHVVEPDATATIQDTDAPTKAKPRKAATPKKPRPTEATETSRKEAA